MMRVTMNRHSDGQTSTHICVETAPPSLGIHRLLGLLDVNEHSPWPMLYTCTFRTSSLWTTYYQFTFTVPVWATQVLHAGSPCLSNQSQHLQIAKSFWGDR